MAFHGCPECGATVRADLIERHERWHHSIDSALSAPIDVPALELEEWPAVPAADEGPARHEAGGL